MAMEATTPKPYRAAAAAAIKNPDKKKKTASKKLTAEEEWELKLKEAESSAPDVIVQDGRRFLALWLKSKTLVKACWISQSYALKLGSAGIKWGDCKKVFENRSGYCDTSSSYDVYRLMRGWFSCVIDEATKTKDLGLEFLRMDPAEPVANAVWDKLEAMVQTYCENYQSAAKWSGSFRLEPFVPPKEKRPGMTTDEIRGVLKDNAQALHTDWWYYMKDKNPPLMARLYNSDNNQARGTPQPQLGGVPTPLPGANQQVVQGIQLPAADMAAMAADAVGGGGARAAEAAAGEAATGEAAAAAVTGEAAAAAATGEAAAAAATGEAAAAAATDGNGIVAVS
ncbi:hypothetical protein HXX76_015738 [Chlamydomonas incerta]|uniref:Uncharacterized protein n=1 Tax=Chlamydomonas incerta TaxID=51695 RepID=A0A835SC17_CHLIN|nr:hypothetical protein HXX76_015738 [Chlamydomonas incerta]|eukprot:KAG2422791.1 hypothetical protein HXX76_015738 [Chlamydomonas incerta]